MSLIQLNVLPSDSDSQSALGHLLISSLLCALAMLFKEQGITVLVSMKRRIHICCACKSPSMNNKVIYTWADQTDVCRGFKPTSPHQYFPLLCVFLCEHIYTVHSTYLPQVTCTPPHTNPLPKIDLD